MFHLQNIDVIIEQLNYLTFNELLIVRSLSKSVWNLFNEGKLYEYFVKRYRLFVDIKIAREILDTLINDNASITFHGYNRLVVIYCSESQYFWYKNKLIRYNYVDNDEIINLMIPYVAKRPIISIITCNKYVKSPLIYNSTYMYNQKINQGTVPYVNTYTILLRNEYPLYEPKRILF